MYGYIAPEDAATVLSSLLAKTVSFSEEWIGIDVKT